MVVAILVILALITLSVFEYSAALGFVLAGLIFIVWTLHFKLESVTRKLKELEGASSQKNTALRNAQTQGDEPRGWGNQQPSAQERSASSQEPSTRAQESSATIQQSPSTVGADGSGRNDNPAFVVTAAEAEQAESSASNAASRPLNKAPESASLTQRSIAQQIADRKAQTRALEVPAEPKGPNIIEKMIAFAWGWVNDGNVFVRVGMIVLFMGMTFLTRYAIGQGLIPIEVRLAFISVVAMALLFWGWRQRDAKPSFALVVQGGGIGLLYLTIFAGFSLYDVIPSTVAFILLSLIVILAAILAVVQDAKPLALFATIGGFLAPILTSSGNNNYIGLFSYYALLNLGIFAVAWFKSWRILNFVGFVFTFLVSTVWGVLSYQEAFFRSTEPFLILFFLLYVAIGILFAHKRTPFYKNYVDSSLIFGTPIFAFGLQCAMVKSFEYGVAISAAVLGLFYLVLTFVLWKKYGSRLRLLTETFLSLGVIFTTLAIPFAIDGYLSGAAWAIEGAGILWVSIKQQQKYRRFFGVALIFAAGVMIIYGLQTAITLTPFINSFFIGCVIVAIAATLASWLLSKEFDGKLRIESTASNALLLYAVVALLGGFEMEIFYFKLYDIHGPLLAMLSVIAIIVYTALAVALKWSKGNWVSVGSILPLGAAAISCFVYQDQLSELYGYALWPFALTACFYGFKRAVGFVNKTVLLVAHILAALIIVGLLVWDGIWQLMFVYSVLAIVFNYLSHKYEWPQLKVVALGFFPVLVLCSVLAIIIDGNLVTLSNVASNLRPPFPPGVALWPFSFAVYFYLVYQNRDIGGANNKYLHYAGGALIGLLLLWLGTAPLLLGACLLTILFCTLWQKFDWPEMRIISMALLPLMILTTTIKFGDNSFHIAALGGLDFIANFEVGIVLWPLAFLIILWTFAQYEKREKPAPALMHSAALLLLTGLLTWEVSWHVLDFVVFLNAWHMAWLPIVSMVMISLILKATVWPFSRYEEMHQRFTLPVLAIIPIAWSFLQLFSSGGSTPLPWMPLINPLGIIQIIILIGAYYWSLQLSPNILKRLSKEMVFYGVLAYGFLAVNAELLRAVHHWRGVPWQLPIILSADISQTVIAIFWALSGLFITTYASKKQDRTLWFLGSALLVAVVLKLFLIDLSAQDTIERIVSFTGVGLLLVVVGYFSPLPPSAAKPDALSNDDVIAEEESHDV